MPVPRHRILARVTRPAAALLFLQPAPASVVEKLRALGHISYSLYLIHLPVLLSAVYLLLPILPIGAILVGVPPAALAAAWIFNRLVEDPAGELGRRIAARLRPAGLAAMVPPA